MSRKCATVTAGPDPKFPGRWFDKNGNVVDFRMQYKEKNSYLSSWYPEYDCYSFYKYLFPADTISTYVSKADLSSGSIPKPVDRPTPLVSFQIDNEDRKHYHRVKMMFNDYIALDYCLGNRFALCSCISYSGKKRSKDHAYRCHGFAIDLDAVTMVELKTLILGIDNDILPRPTFIVNSGSGLHLYYVFEEPVPVTSDTTPVLNQLKQALTDEVWTSETSLKAREYQGIFQCYRMVGSWCKFAMHNKKTSSFTVRAYKTGDRVDLTYLSGFTNVRVPHDLASSVEAKVPIAEAAIMWPSWYDRVVVNGVSAGQYVQNVGLYHWWLNIVSDPNNKTYVRDGNRYHCLCVLFSMGQKCNIPFDTVYSDAAELVSYLDSLTIRDDNHFTDRDLASAASFYNPASAKLSNKGIQFMTGFDPTRFSSGIRRNGRTRAEHLKRARVIRTNLGSYENVGRPSKENLIMTWRRNNPGGSKSECRADLGISRPTINKYWQ